MLACFTENVIRNEVRYLFLIALIFGKKRLNEACRPLLSRQAHLVYNVITLKHYIIFKYHKQSLFVYDDL